MLHLNISDVRHSDGKATAGLTHFTWMPWLVACPRGLKDAAATKGAEMEQALLEASQNGKIPIVIDTSPCLSQVCLIILCAHLWCREVCCCVCSCVAVLCLL